MYGHSNAVVADLFYQAYGSNGVMILALFPYGIGVLVGAPLSGTFLGYFSLSRSDDATEMFRHSARTSPLQYGFDG